jgi:hypothetical protein
VDPRGDTTGYATGHTTGSGPVGYYLKVLKGVLLTGRFVIESSFLEPRFWAFCSWILVFGSSFLDPHFGRFLGVLILVPRRFSGRFILYPCFGSRSWIVVHGVLVTGRCYWRF